MKWSSWHWSLVGVIASAIVLIVLSPFASEFLGGIIVEILGAFLGLFAAVALGEIVKLRQDSQIAERVRVELTEELKAIVRGAEKDPHSPGAYEVAYWDAAMAAGELGVLDRYFRRILVTAYNAISNHNNIAGVYEDRANEPGASPTELERCKRGMMASEGKMLEAVRLMLDAIEEYELTGEKELP